MNQTLRAGIGAILALAAIIGTAQAFDLQAGGEPKLRPTKAQLGIKSPADGVCPGAAKVTAWVFSNKPGTIDILLVNKNGGVFGPYPVKTVEGAGGVVMGTLNTGFMIDAPTETKYRIVIAGTNVVSNWVPLTACL
jgi:hypothetical protein